MDGFFAFIMFIAGVYIISGALALKRDGKINPSLMRSPKNAQNRIKDTEGFTAYMYPKVMTFGVVTVAVGLGFLLLIVISRFIGALASGILELVMIVAFFVVLFRYMHYVKEAEKKFSGLG